MNARLMKLLEKIKDELTGMSPAQKAAAIAAIKAELDKP